MPHFITDTCVGCTICALKCPTGAIAGNKKDLHSIDPTLCIDCSVCGHYCPYDSIVDDMGDLVVRVKASQIHKAIVSFDHKSPNDLTNGTIAGVIQREELVESISKVAGSFNVCDGPTLETLKTTIRQASDIMQDGTNRPGVPCDGISIGIGFNAKRVGPPKTPAGPPAAPVDNCKADGGTEAGTDGGKDGG